MGISEAERLAIVEVLAAGEQFGYGNMISHLSTRWARMLMEKHGLPEKTARLASRGDGYPFKMQDDLIERGEWDHTGASYARPKKPTKKPRRKAR